MKIRREKGYQGRKKGGERSISETTLNSITLTSGWYDAMKAGAENQGEDREQKDICSLKRERKDRNQGRSYKGEGGG